MDLDDFDSKDPAKWFRRRGLPVPASFPKVDEVRDQAKARTGNILADSKTLSQILERHEDTLQKRWLKKSKKQQRLILLEVWPNMAPSHRPDIEALRKFDPQHWIKYRDWLMWPLLNLEDLLVRNNILHLLHNRGHNHPAVFARSDFDRIGTAIAARAIELPFLVGYNMFLSTLR